MKKMEELFGRLDPLALKLRQKTMLLFLGLFSLYESSVWFNHLQEAWFPVTRSKPFLHWLVYHIGDFNNSFGLALLVDLVLCLAVKKRKSLRVVLASVITIAVFAVIEVGDLLDLPAALIGVVCYMVFRL